MGELSERLDACIAVENTIAEIYVDFGNRFPVAMSFFRVLAKEEENHAAILAIGKEFDRVGKLPEDVVPESMPHIHGSLNLIKNVKERIKGREITLKDALEMSLSMEETKVESYVQETRGSSRACRGCFSTRGRTSRR
jgi:rubrerythrin